MSKLTLAIPSVGEKVTVAEPKVDTAFAKLEEWANGKVGTENIEAGTVTEAMLATAVQEKLTTNVGLVLKKQTTSVEGETQKLYLMETNATTLTLPTPTANRMIGVSCLNGIAGVKVKAASGKIYGDFTNGSTEVTLTENQHVLVEADGSNWRIVAGEPKREAEYSGLSAKTRAECQAGFTLSASRPVQAQIKIVSEEATWGAKVLVNEKAAGYFLERNSGVVGTTIPVYVPPGQTVKVQKDTPAGTELAAGVSVEISTLAL